MMLESPPDLVVSPFDSERRLRLVRYLCSCGHSQPLCRLYFCRYCADLRCGRCVCHEVDSHYCPNCLENMPSAEARLKKNRCANCFDCPSCGHTLSTRATTTTTASPPPPPRGAKDGEALAAASSAPSPAPAMPKKVYYLACGFCRWTTRDIGLQDQPVASGGWSEQESPSAARFAQLQDHYRGLAQREKLERESRRFLGRKLSYMQLADKYGLSAAFARRKAGLPPLSSAPSSGPPSSSVLTEGGPSSDGSIQQQVASSDARGAEEVMASFNIALMFEKAPDLHLITRLEQRLAKPDTQPELSRDARPRHKHLAVKKSQRCRKCEHNLSKPEYNPTSIKFKIQLAAFYHVPEVIIFSWPTNNLPLESGKVYNLVLKVTNPAQHPTEIHLAELDDGRIWESGTGDENQDQEDSRESQQQPIIGMAGDKDEGGLPPKLASLHSLSLAVRPSFQIKASGNHRVRPNATFICRKGGKRAPTTSTVLLPQRDDAAEFDEGSGERDALVDDDKDLVSWRKANKVGLNIEVVVDPDLQAGTEVVTGFNLAFIYTNTVPALDQREVQMTRVSIPVYVVLGRIGSPE